jgi:primosomal protein N'
MKIKEVFEKIKCANCEDKGSYKLKCDDCYIKYLESNQLGCEDVLRSIMHSSSASYARTISKGMISILSGEQED